MDIAVQYTVLHCNTDCATDCATLHYNATLHSAIGDASALGVGNPYTTI